MEIAERVYATTERYRLPILLAAGLPSGRDVQAGHGALAQAALDRDADTAVRLLEEHYQRTADDLAQAIERNDETKSGPVTNFLG